MDNLTREFNQLSVSKRKPSKKQVPKILPLLKIEVLVDPTILKIDQLAISPGTNCCKINNALTYIILDKKEKEYKNINALFAKDRLRVKSVKKVNNPYIKKGFELKRHMNYDSILPKMLFHGTKQNYVDNICTYNFDWRYGGCETGHRYGKGVNFSTSAYFATFFCDRKWEKVMILADVLVDEIAEGNKNMVVPPRGTDTTTGKNGTVFVKFYDNEFYPRYVVKCCKMMQPQ